MKIVRNHAATGMKSKKRKYNPYVERYDYIPEMVNRATRRAAMSMKRKQCVANNHAETKRENN
tara:strand:- start:306 stop:494 length:189 start_codon:yes stop_codon:yes gene_type:complete